MGTHQERDKPSLLPFVVVVPSLLLPDSLKCILGNIQYTLCGIIEHFPPVTSPSLFIILSQRGASSSHRRSTIPFLSVPSHDVVLLLVYRGAVCLDLSLGTFFGFFFPFSFKKIIINFSYYPSCWNLTPFAPRLACPARETCDSDTAEQYRIDRESLPPPPYHCQ